jgi:hypothetical protein
MDVILHDKPMANPLYKGNTKTINNNFIISAVKILERGEWEAISLPLLLLLSLSLSSSSSFKNNLKFPEKFNKSSDFLFATSADFCSRVTRCWQVWTSFFPSIQNVPGGKVNILGGYIIGHSKQKNSVYVQLFHCIVHCGDEQHSMSSHELQSALMLTVKFFKMYHTR